MTIPNNKLIFGTFTCPPEEPKAFGIKVQFPKNYIGQILFPILPKAAQKYFIKKRNKEATQTENQRFV